MTVVRCSHDCRVLVPCKRSWPHGVTPRVCRWQAEQQLDGSAADVAQHDSFWKAELQAQRGAAAQVGAGGQYLGSGVVSRPRQPPCEAASGV